MTNVIDLREARFEWIEAGSPYLNNRRRPLTEVRDLLAERCRRLSTPELRRAYEAGQHDNEWANALARELSERGEVE